MRLKIRDNHTYADLSSGSPFDVNALEGVESCQYTRTSHSSQDVSTSTFHHGHEPLILQDLNTAVKRVLVLHSLARSHHHSSSDRVDGVRGKSSGNSDDPSQQEGDEDTSIVAKEDGLQRVIQTEVETTVDKDPHSRYGESSVQALDTVGLQGLDIDVDQTVELALATSLALGVVGEPGPGVVETVDEDEGHGTSTSS